jgi:hypothetical protein
MNYQMNSLDKTLVELHGMLKIAKESIENNHAHVIISKGEQGEKALDAWAMSREGMLPKIPQDLILSQRASLALLLMMNASTVMTRDIGQLTTRTAWRISIRRREAKLLLRVKCCSN